MGRKTQVSDFWALLGCRDDRWGEAEFHVLSRTDPVVMFHQLNGLAAADRMATANGYDVV